MSKVRKKDKQDATTQRGVVDIEFFLFRVAKIYAWNKYSTKS